MADIFAVDLLKLRFGEQPFTPLLFVTGEIFFSLLMFQAPYQVSVNQQAVVSF